MKKLHAGFVVFMLATLRHSHAANIKVQPTPPDYWTFLDQEIDLQDHESLVSGSGSGSATLDDFDEIKYQWLKRFNTGELQVANNVEIDDLVEFIAEHHKDDYRFEATLVSQAALTQMEDGPTKLVEEKDKRPRTLPGGADADLVIDGQTLEEVDAINYYPQYAVGILDNNCTAFLISPRHALTTANCVYQYDTGEWEDELDFWRGRNGDEYLSKMCWKHVVISGKFFITGDSVYNWALITFTEDTASPVWLKMAYSPSVHDVAMTIYGYLPDDHPSGVMYSTICHSDYFQNDTNSLSVQCGTGQKFSGGPILKGYNFQQSKMPLVHAISIAYHFSYAHEAVNFHPSLFWTLCYLMHNDGFDAKCGLLQ